MAARNSSAVRRKPSPRAWTYQEYLRIPDDGYRYEVVWGELSMPPSPTPAHQRVVVALSSILLQHVTAHDLGAVYVAPLDVVLSEQNVLQPDVLFVAKGRLHIVVETHVAGAPDLVVEVLSPGSAALDRGRRMDAYAAHGVAYCWLVDPRSRTFEAYRLVGGRFELTRRLTEAEAYGPALFPGLTIALPALW